MDDRHVCRVIEGGVSWGGGCSDGEFRKCLFWFDLVSKVYFLGSCSHEHCCPYADFHNLITAFRFDMMKGLWPFLCRLKYETVVVHLNDGSEILGVVQDIDSGMNTELRHVRVIRGGALPVYLDVIYIRGKMIWYFALPDALPLEKLLGAVGQEGWCKRYPPRGRGRSKVRVAQQEWAAVANALAGGEVANEADLEHLNLGG